MINTLITLLVYLLVLGLLWWVAMQLVAAFGLPAPVVVIVKVIFVVVAVLLILGLFFGGTGLPRLNLR